MEEIGRGEEAFTALLRALRNTGLQADLDSEGGDLRLYWRGRPISLEVKSVGHGWPGDARLALEKLGTRRSAKKVLFFAPKLAQSSKELIVDRGANWLDARGSLHISIPGEVLIHIDQNAPEGRSDAPFSWSRSAFDIGEYLLVERPERFTLADVATHTGWSKPRVSKILQQWDLLGWTSRFGQPRGRGAWRELIAPESLLEAWSAERAAPARHGRIILAHAAIRDVAEFARQELTPALEVYTSEFSFTSWVAAAEVAPFSTVVPSAHVYVPTAFIESGRYESVLQTAGLKEVDEGAVVRLESALPEVFRDTTHRRAIPLASIPRVYADLRLEGGRGEAAAQHLRETAIGF